jgi:6-phosphogluconolactonase (cycloisomerase 2 family)
MTVPRRRLGGGLAVGLLAGLVAACGGSAPGATAGRAANAAARSVTRCTTAVAAAARLPRVRSTMIRTSGSPFGVAATADGRWAFVDELGGPSRVAVFSTASSVPRLVRTIAVPASAVGNSLTKDGRYLLVADGSFGATVVSVQRAEQGEPNAVLGRLEPAVARNGGPRARLGSGAIEVSSSNDGHYAFVSVEYGDVVAVYDLEAAIADHFARSSYVGSVPLGQSVVGSAVSPDGRYLYVTSELAAGQNSLTKPGTLSVIDIERAEADPAHSVTSTVSAGCQPVRVVVSSDGRTVWVTARASDALLAFSAAELVRSPALALRAAVRVGEAPVGLTLARDDTRLVIADSNRFGAPGATAALTVVNAAAALAGRPAILGTIPAGSFPREMAVDGSSLLVGNFASEQLEDISVPSLP